LCDSQTDCDPYGRICDLATGTCVPCTSDLECGTGKICSAGTCTIDGGGGGGGGGDGTCTSRAECEPQACSILLGMCMPCMMDFDCFDMSDLFTGVSKICDPATGNCIDPECTTANDCPAGEGCYSGHCGACLYDDECRVGEVCNESTGVCEPQGSTQTGCTDHSECPDYCDVGSGECV
jgi:Cys-rich repeat protein